MTSGSIRFQSDYDSLFPSTPNPDLARLAAHDEMLQRSLTGDYGNRVAQEVAGQQTSTSWFSPEKVQSAGAILGIGAALSSAIGSFYSAKSARYQLKAQESALRFRSEMSNINARMAENQAQQIMESSRQQMSLAALNYSQQQAAARVSTAARGVQAGVGSAAEVATSQEYLKRRALYTMDINAVRQAGAARMQRANILTEQSMLNIQAEQARAMRSGISPELAAGSTLLGSTGQLMYQYGRGLRYGQRSNYGEEY